MDENRKQFIKFRPIHTKVSQKFCNILVQTSLWDILWLKQFKPWKILVVVGVMTHCAIVHFVWSLKATEMNVQQSQIQELILSLNWATMLLKQPKTFVVQKMKGQLSMITKWFKKFCSGSKNFNNQARSDWPQTGFHGHAPSHRTKIWEYQASLASQSD